MRLMAAQSKVIKTKSIPAKFVPAMGMAERSVASLEIDEPMTANNQTKVTMKIEIIGITMLPARKLNQAKDSMGEWNCREPEANRV